MCEYTHAMGNSCGDIAEYWDMIYNNEQMMGAVFLGIVQHFLADGIKGGIHHADHIHKLRVVVPGIGVLQTFIVNGSCIVAVLDVVCSLEECLTKGALIAEGPDDNAGTVFVPFYKSSMSARDTGSKEFVFHFGKNTRKTNSLLPVSRTDILPL